MRRTYVPPTGGDGGFTLLEALVVLGITAMIGGLVFPNLQQGVAGAEFVEAVAGVRADLRMARAAALQSDSTVDLTVTSDGRSYGWTGGPNRGLLGRLTLSPGASLRFFPDGSSSGADLVLSDGRAQAAMHVDPSLGVLGAGR
jgi:general secretion pathway protein H